MFLDSTSKICGGTTLAFKMTYPALSFRTDWKSHGTGSHTVSGSLQVPPSTPTKALGYDTASDEVIVYFPTGDCLGDE